MSAATPRRTPRWIVPTYGLAGLAFAGLAGGLVAQLSTGEDPALGAPVQEATIPLPHYVVTRRVERVRVVVRRVRDLPPIAPTVSVAAAPAATAGAVPAPAVAAAPVAAAPAPAASAPVAAPAPAPAAVPAPVSRAS